MKKIKVCVVEYETRDSMIWKATILAYSIEEAINHIRSKVPGYYKLLSTAVDRTVDAIETSVFNDYFTKIEENVTKKTVEKVVYVDSEDKECPWCKKKLKNSKTLITHIRKYHKD